MDFLNVGPWELVLVLIITILVAGPKRMVEIASSLGRLSRQLRDMSREFTSALQAEIEASESEAGSAVADLRRAGRDLDNALSGALSPAAVEQDEPDSPTTQTADKEGKPAAPATQTADKEGKPAAPATQTEPRGDSASAQPSPIETQVDEE
ncbi:MAG: twin-arginine translocase TatA/TatE family subunit [Chloroflexota bacterium]|nr:twin-arginine translocase TatA/TatE family subunit [Chloroflexota bacterium]